MLGKPRENRSFASDSRWVLPQSLIGVEYEYEGVKDRHLPVHNYAGLWDFHEEGSLRDSGAEYVFHQPMFGVDAFNAVNWLMDHALEKKWKCTIRTGIHVHIDVRDIEVPQLVGMTLLYAALEPILYEWIGDNRENSHFCVPLYKADEALLGACGIVSNSLTDMQRDSMSVLQASENFERYSGLNFQSLSKFGSLEFRHMQTTHDKERVFNWINMIMSLKAASYKLPESDGAAVRMMARMGTMELLEWVFGNRLAGLLFTINSNSALQNVGFPAARDIAVHGCAASEWGAANYPKGEHLGFKQFMKIEKKPRSKEEVIQDEYQGAMNQAFGAQVPQAVRFLDLAVDDARGARMRAREFQRRAEMEQALNAPVAQAPPQVQVPPARGALRRPQQPVGRRGPDIRVARPR